MQFQFDARNVAPAAPQEIIPEGWYPATITNTEMKPTSNGSGAYLNLELTLGGPANGKKLYDRLNVQNPNQQAVEIAYRTLSAICHAVGQLVIQDTQQLQGRPFEVKIGIEAAGVGGDGKNYDARNNVKGYRAVGSGQAPAAQAPAGFAGSPAPAPQAAPAAQSWQQPNTGNPQGQPPAQQPWQAPQAPAAAAPPAWQQPQAQAPAQAPAAGAPPPWAAQGAPAQPPQQAPQQPWQQQPAQQPAGAPPPWAR